MAKIPSLFHDWQRSLNQGRVNLIELINRREMGLKGIYCISAALFVDLSYFFALNNTDTYNSMTMTHMESYLLFYSSSLLKVHYNISIFRTVQYNFLI